MYHVNARDLPGNDVSRTFEGGQHGPCTVSFFLVHNRPGQGPSLHRHAYDETFIILEGNLLVRVGDESLEGGPGDIVIGPAGAPHGFTNIGPGPARLVCIHAAPEMKTECVDLAPGTRPRSSPPARHVPPRCWRSCGTPYTTSKLPIIAM